MRVHFKQSWFAPTEGIKERHILVRRGKLYKKGIHDNVPEFLRDMLPSTAKIMDEEPVKTMEVKEAKGNEGLSLRDYDQDRAAADALIEAAEKAQANAE